MRSQRDLDPVTELPQLPEETKGSPARDLVPDSRHPLIAPEVRAKIEAIETEARSKGWPAELLWNNNFIDLPRGLAAILGEYDQIIAVDAEEITIVVNKRDIWKFRRRVS